jgi:NADH-quinone oxidoreductase subunit M
LWIIVEIIEQRYGTTRLSELGGLATRAPSMAILFLVIALANIALPLTNSFIGEFMMFTGIFTSPVFRYEYFLVPAAGICIILGAVYTLRMVQQVLYGEVNAVTERGNDIPINQQLVLWIMVILILFIGVYPEPFLELTRETTTMILKEADVSSLLGK